MDILLETRKRIILLTHINIYSKWNENLIIFYCTNERKMKKKKTESFVVYVNGNLYAVYVNGSLSSFFMILINKALRKHFDWRMMADCLTWSRWGFTQPCVHRTRRRPTGPAFSDSAGDLFDVPSGWKI